MACFFKQSYKTDILKTIYLVPVRGDGSVRDAFPPRSGKIYGGEGAFGRRKFQEKPRATGTTSAARREYGTPKSKAKDKIFGKLLFWKVFANYYFSINYYKLKIIIGESEARESGPAPEVVFF